MDVVGYRVCSHGECGQLVLDTTAWQTGGVCFDCFIAGDMSRFREVEVIQRANHHRVSLSPANPVGKKRKRNSGTENVTAADLARLRALRRMRVLFPEVFDLLYAEERHKAGLAPRPKRNKDHLKNAVETYLAFAAYYAASDRRD